MTIIVTRRPPTRRSVCARSRCRRRSPSRRRVRREPPWPRRPLRSLGTVGCTSSTTSEVAHPPIDVGVEVGVFRAHSAHVERQVRLIRSMIEARSSVTTTCAVAQISKSSRLRRRPGRAKPSSSQLVVHRRQPPASRRSAASRRRSGGQRDVSSGPRRPAMIGMSARSGCTIG